MKLNCTASTLLGRNADSVKVIPGDEEYVARILSHRIDLDLYDQIRTYAKGFGVTEGFKKVIQHFKVPSGETPAGFRVEYNMDADGAVRADLVRDISYDKNGQKRQTNLLFSADSANPY